jgi:DNA polymerase III subunit gamma/tau
VAETSLYRRHRPQSFDEVVGQEHVVRTLRNAIERDRVHHAYLFVGSRGTGKTSMAKILARSLNCVQGPTVTPCGECESCLTIAAGTSLDVIEMDAASNRSVDDIRELRERVGYVPAAGRWKVYILDEAHMLTREAWNAFLKTLEEPPPNTVFVLATTEAHKVMPTIVDRCQRFDFGRPSAEQIAEVVRRAAAAEGITIPPEAISTIARGAGGSFRDALGTLDQLTAYSGDEIATEDVLIVLGVADADLLYRAADAVARGEGKAVLAVAAELAASGRDPSRFASDLVAHLRRLLVVATAGEVPDHFFATPEQAERLAAQSAALGEVEIVRAIDSLSDAIAAIREGDEARMTLELALLRAARPEIDPSRQALAHRLERLERSLDAGAVAARTTAPPGEGSSQAEAGAESASEPGASGAAAPVGTIARGAVATAEGVRSKVEEVRADVEARVDDVRADVEARAEEVRSEIEARAGAAADAAAVAVDLERIAGMWPAIVDQVRESGSEFLSAAFQAARPTRVDAENATVEIGFPASAAFNKRKAEAKENRERFSDAVRAIVGTRLSPTYVLLDEDEAQGGADGPAERVDDRELVERFKAEFDAEELIDDPEEAEG